MDVRCMMCVCRGSLSLLLPAAPGGGVTFAAPWRLERVENARFTKTVLCLY